MRTHVLLVLLALAGPARAEIYEIPLPDMIGAYPNVRDVTFQLPGPPAVVRGASLRLVGTTEVGTLTCDEVPPVVYPWTTTSFAIMEHDVFAAEAQNGTVAGPFEIVVPFKPYTVANPTWDFLLDGEGTFTFYGMPTITVLGCGTSEPPPTFTITGARIRVDADIPTPVVPRSWGQLKTAYR